MTAAAELARADAAARAAALDPQRSILLQAPAGSGKTAVLTQRFLRLLAQVDDPTEILAITFTRKAAAEMRGRVTRALRGELAADDPAAAKLQELAAAARAHAARRGWELGRDAAQLRIQTIDSFNYWLAAQLPLAARAGGTLHVTETPRELYRRAARRTLSGADADAALGAALELLFERLDNRWLKVERMLAEMLAQRAHWLHYVLADAGEGLPARVNAGLAAIAGERLAAAHALLPAPLRAALAALPGVGALGSTADDLPHWRALADKVMTQGREWRRSLSVRLLGAEYASASARAYLADCIELLKGVSGAAELLGELKRLPGPALSDADSAALAALALVLRHGAAQLQTEFALSQRVDYSYVTGAAREALGPRAAPTDLGLRTGLKLQHILVDEFQDTSLAQSELLEALTGGWEAGDGRTLFVVGDPMQSIYRFRDAEVGLFLAARTHGIGGVRLEALRLTHNFRAAPALIEWCNEVFAAAFPGCDDLRAGAVAFSASDAARAHAPTSAAGVTLRRFPDPTAEARALAAAVAAVRAAQPHASVAVLVAAHAHAGPIVRELAALDVAAIGVDLVPLAERAVVRDLVQLTRALYDLADRPAWLALLRSPVCGARLASLTALSAAEDPQLLWEALHDPTRLARCAPEEQARLLRVRAVLAAALARRDAGPVAEWLEATWLGLGGADAYGLEELEDARRFFAALAERTAAGEWQGPQDFAPLLENLYSAAPTLAPHPVQIMTIHRAKGLEFDHVFVPALERAGGSGERALLRFIDLPRADGGSDLIMASAPRIGDEDAGEVDALIGRLQAQRSAHERTRLMYVAATRARESLYLSAALTARADGSLRPESRSLLAQLWPVLHERFSACAAPPAAAAPSAPPPLRRLIAGWRPAALAPAAALTQLPLAPAALEPPEFSWVGETARHVGTVVHALLAEAARATPPWQPQALGVRRAAVQELLRVQGVSARERGAAAERALSALERTLADARGRWILNGPHREAASELALTGLAAGQLRSVVIDRCFVDAHGTRWVIDYKTSRHEGGDLAGFLEQEMQRYAGQLATYLELAASLGPEPVRAALYFPLIGAFREFVPPAE